MVKTSISSSGQTTVTLLFMVVLLRFISVGDCEDVIQLRGEFGGEVAFRCPVDRNARIKYLYLLKKGNIFVNGYYKSENMQQHNPWPNSRVDRERNIVYVSGLNISHSGVYTCQFEYEGRKLMEPRIKLTIRANYSQPSVRVMNCTDNQDQCLVQCSSYGGYPKTILKWNMSGGNQSTNARTWRIVSRIEDTDKDTELFNISNIAAFNCSTREQQNISCSVEGITTHHPICEQQDCDRDENNHVKIIVPICIIFIVLLVLCCVWKKNKIRQLLGANHKHDADNGVL